MSLAARGLRDMDDGPEAMERAERAAVRRQARSIQIRAGAVGLFVMLGAWLLL